MNKETTHKNILFVTHPWGGGVSTFISDLNDLFKDEFNMFVLKCADGSVVLEHGLDHEKKAHYYKLPHALTSKDLTDPDYRKVCALILEAFNIDLVHINSTVGHTFDIFELPKQFNIPVIFTVHDFYCMCPSIHLIYKDGMYCGGCDLDSEKEDCLIKHPCTDVPDFDKDMLKRWREKFNDVKDSVDLFTFPSFSASEIFSSFYKISDDKIKVIYHGIPLRRDVSYYMKEPGEVLQVAILGSMYLHKGKPLVKFILKQLLGDEEIKFHLFGEVSLKSANLVNHGKYDQSNIVNLLRENRIDIVMILSTWPETFSYTLSESLASGIPLIVTNMGALKERVEKDQVGWVVDYKDPEKICELLRFLKGNRGELYDRFVRIKKSPLKTMKVMRAEYDEIYTHMLRKDLSRVHDETVTSKALSMLKGLEKRPGPLSLPLLKRFYRQARQRFF